MTHKLKSFKHFSISIFRMMAYTLNNFKTVLTCSPAWHLAARCSWKGSAVICWCCHTELSGAGGPIWACSHTIATYRNTLTMKYSDNGLQICKIICKKTQNKVWLRLPVLSRRWLSGSPLFHSGDILKKTNTQKTMLTVRLRNHSC